VSVAQVLDPAAPPLLAAGLMATQLSRRRRQV